jgi:hypothetical protein
MSANERQTVDGMVVSVWCDFINYPTPPPFNALIYSTFLNHDRLLSLLRG